MPPPLPDDVVPADLDRAARGRLRTLSKDNADGVARHLVMAGRLLDTEPELAYEHAQAAVRRAGRVDVVREAAGITAYRTGRFAEALRELRTVRRLNGSDEHLPLLADCERGLGRPERAIALSQEDAARALPDDLKVELAIVVAGARLDLGDPDAALAALGTPVVHGAAGEAAERVARARADALRAAGRGTEADALLATLPGVADEDDEVVVYDLHEDVDDVADVADVGDLVDVADAEPGLERARDSAAGRDGASGEGGAAALDRDDPEGPGVGGRTDADVQEGDR